MKIVQEFISYFKNKKNLFNLLVLAILVLAVPLGVNLARQQQILKSRAEVAAIVFSGPNVKTVKNKLVATKNEINIEITAPDDTGAASSTSGSSSGSSAGMSSGDSGASGSSRGTGSGSSGGGSGGASGLTPGVPIGGSSSTWQSPDMKFQSKIPFTTADQVKDGAIAVMDQAGKVSNAAWSPLFDWVASPAFLGLRAGFITPQQATAFLKAHPTVRDWWNREHPNDDWSDAGIIHAWLPGAVWNAKSGNWDRDGITKLLQIVHSEDNQGVSNPDQIIAMFPDVKIFIIESLSSPKGSAEWPASCFLREWIKIGPSDPNAQLALKILRQMPGQTGFEDPNKGCDFCLHYSREPDNAGEKSDYEKRCQKSVSLPNLMSLLPKSLVGIVYAGHTDCSSTNTFCGGDNNVWQDYCDSDGNPQHSKIQDCANGCENGQCKSGGGGGGNYCEAAGYHKCSVGAPAGNCQKDGKTCTAYETYQCNFEGQNYCDTSNCADPCSANSCPSGQQQVGGSARDKIKNGDYLVDNQIVGPNLQAYTGTGQCGYKYNKWESTLANGDFCVTYSFGSWQNQNACPKGSSPPPSPSGRVSPPPGGSPPPSPSGRVSPPPGGSPPPSPSPEIISFRIAENQNDLAGAPKRDYTRPGSVVISSFKFISDTPGTKTIFVQFYDKDDKKVGKREQASIQLLGPDPAILSCSLNFEGSNVVFDIKGKNFGAAKGVAKSGENNLQIKEWKDTSAKLVFPNAPVGQSFPIALTNTDEQMAEGTCSAFSIISLGAKVFCRAPSSHDTDNVEMILAGLFEGGKKTKDKVKIDRNGNIQNLIQRLEEGKKYQVSLKAPRSLRRVTEEFTASSGTTSIPNFTLPVGDIFPADGGDGKINTLDKAELNRQWIAGQSASGRSGDFNLDSRVNSIDWACMRYDFGQEDASEPLPGVPPASPVPSPSVSPSPSPSPSQSPSASPAAAGS